MAYSNRKSRIPALSLSTCKKPSYTSDSLISQNSSSTYESSYRHGVFSTQRKSSTSCFKPNKYSNCYSIGSMKGGRGLFHQSPKGDRMSAHRASSAAASGRRSSILGDKSRQKDTRNLSDPKYQNECIGKLISYLTANGYPSPIPAKFLKSPSKQDVIKVFEFLFSRLDPSVDIIPIEIRVPELMSQYGYSYYITKSSLISFSGRQAIGNLLGMFEFLVDNATYWQLIDKTEMTYPFAVCDDSSKKTEILAITGEEDEDQIDDYAVLNDLGDKILGGDEEDVETEEYKIIQTMEANAREIELRSAIPEKLLKYQKCTDEHLNYNFNMEEYIMNYEQEMADCLELIANCKMETELAREKMNDIEQKVNNQPYDPAEIQLARERQIAFEQEWNEDLKYTKQVKHLIHTEMNTFSTNEDQLCGFFGSYASEINSLLLFLTNSQAVGYCFPLIVEKLNLTKLQAILEKLNNPDCTNKSSDSDKIFYELMTEIERYWIEIEVDLRARSVKVRQNDKLDDLNEEEKRKKLDGLQSDLEQVEQDLQEYKRLACQEESRVEDDKFNGKRKLLTEEKQGFQDFLQTKENLVAQSEQEYKEMVTQYDDLVKRRENLIIKRRDHEAKILESIEQRLRELNDARKKSFEVKRTSVDAWKAVRVRLQRKVDDAKGSKFSDKTVYDESSREKNETYSVSVPLSSKENICIN